MYADLVSLLHDNLDGTMHTWNLKSPLSSLEQTLWSSFGGFQPQKRGQRVSRCIFIQKRCLHTHNSCMCPQVGFGHTYPVRVLPKLSNLPEGVAELLRESWHMAEKNKFLPVW